MIKLKPMVNLNEGSKYRVYMNSDMDEPERIDYEIYFGDGTKEEMIKQAKKMTRSNHATNQYGDPILVKVMKMILMMLLGPTSQLLKVKVKI